MGFIRDVVIAYTFGAGTQTDAFLIAFKIPNFMRRLFAEGAFSQAFIPVLSEIKTQHEGRQLKHLIDQVAGSLGSLLIVVTLIGIISAPVLVFIFAPGFVQQQEKFALTVEMLRLTFPYLFFIALTAFAGGILNTFGRFSVPAFTPVLLNLCLISAALWLTPYFTTPILALAWGVLIAGFVQFFFQLPFLHQLGLLPRPRFNPRDEGVKRISHLMLPALLGVSVSQINLLVDTLMASFLTTGSVSWLYYADRLMEFPVAIFGLALATVILPDLSKIVARGDVSAYSRILDWALRWVFLVTVPAMVGLIVLSEPILATLFHNGQFTTQDVIKTGQSLMAYSIGLSSFVLVKVLASGFYARQDTRTPVKIAIIAMVANIVLNLIFIVPLQHTGLALATALAALLNTSLLYWNLRQQAIFQPQPGWASLFLRVGVASTCMAISLHIGVVTLTEWLLREKLTQALFLLGWISIGMAIYITILFATGFRLQQMRLS